MGDVIAKYNLNITGYKSVILISPWFFAYILTKVVATTAQFYVFSNFDLGKSMAIFGAISIILSNSIGFLLMSERLTVGGYVGVSMACMAFLVIALKG
jgi:multidrug transporter EmrE-like cation transporter